MTNSVSKFVWLEEIARVNNLTSLRIKLCAAEKRVRDAESIGWTALAQSWRRDVDAIKARLDELGAAHALTRRRVDAPHQVASTKTFIRKHTGRFSTGISTAGVS